jgi:DNA repair photolyase
MGLNKSAGNMYEFITHTWNAIKGECPHNCSYCYMHRWGKQKPVRFDEKELKTDLGVGNIIFVGSSCDMFASEIPKDWIGKTLNKCWEFPENKYFFQSKNPYRIWQCGSFELIPTDSIICTTIETNREYPIVMNNCPNPFKRAEAMSLIGLDKYITIEPIMDFDLYEFIAMLKLANPNQVNIGADSGNNNLPEPSKEKVFELISELKKFTTIHKKSNLGRLI